MHDDDIARRLRRFRNRYFPRFRQQFRTLVDLGQQPTTLFIGCSDSRVVPYMLTDTGPGELFIVRNVGAFVPPYDASLGHHGTAAGIEYAVVQLGVQSIVVCGHTHCGAIRALYEDLPEDARHLREWLKLGRDATLPVTVSPEALYRTEQRSIVLQLERLMDYPMVARRVDAGQLFLHGWHYVIEEGKVLVLDVAQGLFVSPGGEDEGLPTAASQLQ